MLKQKNFSVFICEEKVSGFVLDHLDGFGRMNKETNQMTRLSVL